MKYEVEYAFVLFVSRQLGGITQRNSNHSPQIYDSQNIVNHQ